jgi:hypothetical protein
MPTMKFDTGTNSIYGCSDTYEGTKPEDELMMRLAHMPFIRLIKMALTEDLPKTLSRWQILKCHACMYGKATKIPWRIKGNSIEHIRPSHLPGECVSIDQMESTKPGRIAQLKGTPTKLRYRFPTVIVDHHSRYTYVHLHSTITSEETLKAKISFETLAASLGVSIKHYHADNGRFADNNFLKDIENKGQTVSYFGVNAHFQNGIAERRIRDLQERARTMIIHATNHWPKAIDTCLWPYAIRLTCEIDNNTRTAGMLKSRSETFSDTQIRPKICHYHTFGCPT